MPVETAADRAALFADWGVAASYTPPAGPPAVAVTILFDQGRGPATIGPGVPVEGGKTMCQVRRDEIADPEREGTLVIGADTYRIGRVTSDFTGEIFTLDLDPQ